MNRDVWEIGVSLCILLLAGGSSVGVEQPESTKGPYLMHVTPTSIKIHWEIVPGQAAIVRYGPTQAMKEKCSALEARSKQHVELTGLSPSTRYYYQITAGPVRWGPYTFRTAPKGESKFVFCAYGDNRIKDRSFNYPHNHGHVVAGMMTDNPDFIINTGDIFMTGVDTNLFGRDFFDDAAPLIRETPVFLAIGNHEYIGEAAAIEARKYFFSSKNRTWYTAQYAGSEFIFLDSTLFLYKPNPEEPGGRLLKTTGEIETSEQFGWLKDRLARPKCGWRTVVLHHSIFSSGKFGHNAQLVDFLVPLFEAYGVDLVLYGHEHNYERSERNGITYILTGGGGSYLRPVNVNANDHLQAAASEWHHVTVSGLGTKMRIRTVCDVDRGGIPDYSKDNVLSPPVFKKGEIMDEHTINGPRPFSSATALPVPPRESHQADSQ